MLRIGLISDTHGLLRPEALALLQGSDHIVHAGDIGKHEILAALASVAPLTVVRGNNDRQEWARDIPHGARLAIGGVDIYVVHDIADSRTDPAAVGARVIVSGHSHKPLAVERDGVLFINPGSAGPRRFSLPISVGELLISAGSVTGRIREISLS